MVIVQLTPLGWDSTKSIHDYPIMCKPTMSLEQTDVAVAAMMKKLVDQPLTPYEQCNNSATSKVIDQIYQVALFCCNLFDFSILKFAAVFEL